MSPDSVFASFIPPKTEGLEVFPIGVEPNVTLACQKRKAHIACLADKLSFQSTTCQKQFVTPQSQIHTLLPRFLLPRAIITSFINGNSGQ